MFRQLHLAVEATIPKSKTLHPIYPGCRLLRQKLKYVNEMDHSYTGLIVILLFVIVYTLYTSSYLYVSGVNEKYHNFSQKIVNHIQIISNGNIHSAEAGNVDLTSVSTYDSENSSLLAR